MAPKDAKKHMKAVQNKKCKLQTTTDPTSCKTVSNCAPSLQRKCSMQIKIFCGANNLFYLSKNSSLNHCHHPRLKPKAIFHGQSNMETGDIDILTLLFSVNVTPTQISQVMEQLMGSEAGTFMPKCVYNSNKKTEELHDFTHGLLPDSNDSNDAEKILSKLERSNINHFYILHNDTGLYACSKGCASNEEVRIHLDCSAKIQADLERLRDDYILNEKTQMLVMILMATNEMIRLVAMHPDVWFMDTTAGQYGRILFCKSVYLHCIVWIHLIHVFICYAKSYIIQIHTCMSCRHQ
jgi:hypothetical protein